MAVFLLLRVYREQGSAPMAAAECPGEVPAAKTLRFLVGARGRRALRLTRLHMEAALEGAFLDDAVSSSLSMLIRAAISEMTTGPIKIPMNPNA